MVDDSQSQIDAAVESVLEGERVHGVLTYAIGEARAAVLALRATSLAEYVCGVCLALADHDRQYAVGLTAKALRRSPSGRRARTVAEAQVLHDDADRHLTRAAAAESIALAAIGRSDLVAAHRVVAYMIGAEAANWSGSPQEEWDVALEVAERVRVRRRRRERWSFVRGRAEQAPQPRGGLLPRTSFSREELGGAALTRGTESGSAGTIASAVELAARWDLARDPRADLEPSAAALEAIRAVRRGEHTRAAPGLVAAMQRRWDANYDELDELEWEAGEGDETLAHIAEMCARVSRCFKRYGRPVDPGTWAVHSERFRLDGHIDFVTADTIWDLKVSDSAPDRADVLQLLLYWMAFRDEPTNSPTIDYLGIYNPRSDTVWRINVTEIPIDVVLAVESLALSEHP